MATRRKPEIKERVERLLVRLDPTAGCPDCWATQTVSYTIQGGLVPEECIPAPERCRHGRAFRHDHRIRVVLQEVPSGRIMQPGGSVRSGLLPVDEGAARFTLDIDQAGW